MAANTLARRYDRAATTWDGKLTRMGYHAAYDHLIETARLPLAQPRILDAGCGTGAFAAAVVRARPVGAIDLVDAAPAMRNEAARRLRDMGAKVNDCHGDLHGINLKKGIYSTVMAGHFIEHTDDPSATLQTLADCLAPGGVLLLAVSKPHWCTALIRMIWGHRAYNANTVLKWANAADLTGRPVAFRVGPPSRTSMGYVLRGEPLGLRTPMRCTG